MQPGVVVAQVPHLQILDRFNGGRGNQVQMVGDAAQLFQRV